MKAVSSMSYTRPGSVSVSSAISKVRIRAANEVRVRDQSEGCKADRPDDSAQCAGESGQSDPIRQN
jgi:hypothetical protein